VSSSSWWRMLGSSTTGGVCCSQMSYVQQPLHFTPPAFSPGPQGCSCSRQLQVHLAPIPMLQPLLPTNLCHGHVFAPSQQSAAAQQLEPRSPM
jgi:hypothetical protein